MKKNKKKINPMMDSRRIKSKNVGSADENEIRSFIIIVIVLVVVIGAIYGLTEFINNKKSNSNDKTVTSGEINYNIVSVGILLNRPEDEYYVIVYDTEKSDSLIYSTIVNNYKNSSDSLKVYLCDLNNSLNSSYYNVNEDNISNPKATKVSELDFGDLTLIKVKNGNIAKYVEDLDQIKEILK